MRRHGKGTRKGMGTCADRDDRWLTTQEPQLRVDSDHLPRPSATLPPFLIWVVSQMALTLGRLRQEDHKLKASLGYRVKPYVKKCL